MKNTKKEKDIENEVKIEKVEKVENVQEDTLNEMLLKKASIARKNAHTPISAYSVGAALLAKSGKIYLGANIEDATIPNLSNCAERVAIQTAFALGEKDFLKIAVVGGKKGKKEDNTLIPCGVCLQYILDMCEDIDIIAKIDGKITVKKVSDYLNNPYKLNK